MLKWEVFLQCIVNWLSIIKLVGQKLQHFPNDAFQSYYDLFQVNWLVLGDIYISHNNCLGHMLITFLLQNLSQDML